MHLLLQLSGGRVIFLFDGPRADGLDFMLGPVSASQRCVARRKQPLMQSLNEVPLGLIYVGEANGVEVDRSCSVLIQRG